MPKSQNKNNKLTFMNAAYKILKEEKKALHIREISDKAIKKDIIKTDGKTPWHTIGSFIYRDIKEKGEKSNFVKIRKATFSLRKFSSDKNKALKKKGGTFLDYAESVLKNSGGIPMHYKDITKKALKEGLSSDGKTRDATMRGTINTDIKKRQIRGEEPIFERLGKGFFGLAVWNDGLEDSEFNIQVARHQRKIRDNIKKYLMCIDHFEFEEFVGNELLKSMGFKDIVITKRTGDGGVDVLATLNIIEGIIREETIKERIIREGNMRENVEVKFAVQVKRWGEGNNVKLDDVRALRGAVGDGGEYEKRQKMLITTSEFDPGAIREAKLESVRPINLINGEELIDIMLEYRIGVRCSEIKIFQIDEEYSYFNNTEDKS